MEWFIAHACFPLVCAASVLRDVPGDREIPGQPRHRALLEPFGDSLYSLPAPFPSSASEAARPSVTRAITPAKLPAFERNAQESARRRANVQLMRVPWAKFRKAYEEYPHWQGLALWAQLIVATQSGVPAWLVTELRRRCPGLIEEESANPKIVDLPLLSWLHNRHFQEANQQGWLEALAFYGVRHARAECVWTYWEHCDQEWNTTPPNPLPTFDEWWQEAQSSARHRPDRPIDLLKAVESRRRWEAFILWLRPLFASPLNVPSAVIREIRRNCPAAVTGRDREDREKARLWKRVLRCAREGRQSHGGKACDQDTLVQRVLSDPLRARLVAYGRHWAASWPGNSAQPYPSFPQWRRAAERYTVSENE